jgi:uncharacterized protein
MIVDASQLELNPFDLDDLAIFPLPDGVLFPHTTIRLHVYEPRYRMLVEDLIAREAPISVVMIAADGRTDPKGRPNIHRVAGVGAIIGHERLPGGRFNILVRGLSRVRIVEELEVDTPYRRVRAQLLDDHVADPRRADLLLKTIQNCLFNIETDNTELIEFVLEAFTVSESLGAAADVLAAVVFGDARTRQQALGEVDVIARLDAILRRLVELMKVESATEGLRPN